MRFGASCTVDVIRSLFFFANNESQSVRARRGDRPPTAIARRNPNDPADSSMEPVDAERTSRERAGAASVSGDAPLARADDSETSAESVDHRACPVIDDLLPDLASMRAAGGARATDFFRDVWGDVPMRWRVRPETLRAMRAGFRNGDVAALITRDCRTDANDEYDDDDAREMLDRTRPPLRHTLNLPFCFAPGAHALRNSLLRMAYDAPELPEDRAVDEPEEGEPDAQTDLQTDLRTIQSSKSPSSSRLRFANDIDVGVYASPSGGVEASWHYDANHNVTVQLYGSKTWFVTPVSNDDATSNGGAANVNNGRGLVDVPRNARETRDVFDATRVSEFELNPGDAIYVPPGTWHRVVPKSAERIDFGSAPKSKRAETQSLKPPFLDDTNGVASAVCLSADARVANVPRMRWTCESLFHAFDAAFDDDSSGALERAPATTGDDAIDAVDAIKVARKELEKSRDRDGASSRRPRATMDGAFALGDEARGGRGGVLTQKAANRAAVAYLSGGEAEHQTTNDGFFGSKKTRFWYPPRLAPYQPEISDGADLRASLGFLADAFGTQAQWHESMITHGNYAENATVSWHPMVAARVVDAASSDSDSESSPKTSLKEKEKEKAEDDDDDDDDDDAFVLDLRAVSGLTQMEYARLGIVLPRCLKRDVERLVATASGEQSRRRAAETEDARCLRRGSLVLSRAFPSAFLSGGGGDSEAGARRAAEDLLDVLTWCRYLRLTPPEEARSGRRAKRRRGDD